MKALIIQYKKIGNILISSVIANNLKKIYPEIKIDFLCYRRYMGVLQKNPNINRIIAVNGIQINSIWTMYKYIKLIRSEEYDILIDLSRNVSSTLISATSKAKKKYGFSSPFLNNVYDHVTPKVTQPITQSCNVLENQLNILEPFLKDHSIPIDPQAKIFLTEEETAEAKEKMINAGIRFTRPVIMLGVLGADKYNTWTVGNMAKLIDFIWANYRADLLFNYLPSQYKQVNEMLSLLNSNTKVFVQPVGKSVREYSAFMANCSLYIGNYSRAVIAAKALSKPTFTIYPPHVYRKEVACYENTKIHKSVHLQDYLPNLYEDFYQKELYKDAPKFYLMLSNEFVVMKVKNFLNKYLTDF